MKCLQIFSTVMVATLGGMLVACSGSEPSPQDIGESAIECEDDYNPSCADLGLGTHEFKFEPISSGSSHYDIDDLHSITIMVDSDTTYFDWSSPLGMDAVIVKGGPGANVYEYNPEAHGDTGLSSPMYNDSPYELSHISFCYDYELVVTKTAEPTLDREWAWSIDKIVEPTELTLAIGDTQDVQYTVTVEPTGYTDKNFGASGEISVFNPAPDGATIISVADVIGGTLDVASDCGVAFPFYLEPGETLTCTYVASLPDSATVTNVATVETRGTVLGGMGQADIDFAHASVTATDDCVDVDDTLMGSLGTVCAGHGAEAFAYGYSVGPFDVCGSYLVDNTAGFITNTTGAMGSDTASVAVEVACGPGCTLTPGYWKTHSSYGPAPYDDTWALLASGADTLFFESGQTYYEVLWTPVRGNVYYILARAWIAAKLNFLNGADGSAIEDEFGAAEDIFEDKEPAEFSGIKGSERAHVIALAEALDDYNNGLTGPGHCE